MLRAKSVLSRSLALSLSVSMVASVHTKAFAIDETSAVAIGTALKTRLVSEQARVDLEKYEARLRQLSNEERTRAIALEGYDMNQRTRLLKQAPQLEQQALSQISLDSVRRDSTMSLLTNNDQSAFTFRVNTQLQNLMLNAQTVKIATQAPLSVPSKVSLIDAQRAKSSDWRAHSDSFLTPATKVDELKLLKHPLDALSRRIELLTGRQYTRDEVRALAEGKIKLDLSRLPRYNRILISSLEVTKDNLGKALVESLKEHVRRNGTDVRIIVSEAYYNGAERLRPNSGLPSIAYLKAAEAETKGGLKVQFYKYNEPDYDAAGAVSTADFHRVQHAKMSLFINEQEPQKTRAIIGGRNMSNGYFFMSTNEFKPTTSMEPYEPSTYASYSDIELEVKGSTLIRDMTAQYDNFWKRDLTDQRFQAAFQYLNVANLDDQDLGDEKVVRHFLSLPFVNGGEQRGIEPLFVKMISSAKHTIRITTPYFHPTPAVVAALRKALDRNPELKITIVTNMDFSKDALLPETVRAANRQGVIWVGDRAEFRIWNKDGVSAMVHAKTMSIDDETLYVGSANMNHRSFMHDVENGLLIRDRATVANFKENFESFFVRHSRTATAKEIAATVSDSLLLYIARDIF